jgi:hypothetical protein
MDVKLMAAHVELEFEEDFGGREFQSDFDNHSEVDDDPVGHWLRMAKARGETGQSDNVVVTLLLELHRKIDNLTDRLDNTEKQSTKLAQSGVIKAIHFDYLRIDSEDFEVGKRYYGIAKMPSFPKRDISLFFEAISKTDGKIIQLHDVDEKSWGSYVTARERVLIRKRKEKGSTI